MKKTILIILILLSYNLITIGQEEDHIFERLQGLNYNGISFFQVDGYEITSQTVYCKFKDKSIRRKFKPLSIKKSDLFTSDSLLKRENLLIRKSKRTNSDLTQNDNYYFIKTARDKITAITFATMNKVDLDFERHFIDLVFKNKIPKDVFSSFEIGKINFDGRYIHLASDCKWMGVNNVQCPNYGQMNWNIHKTLEEAERASENHLSIIRLETKGKIISEKQVDVIFEGEPVTAKKIIYDFTGITSAMVGLSGGKTLTIFFVVGKGQKNYISCVMSFWNNDSINPSGLPPLLEKIISMKE